MKQVCRWRVFDDIEALYAHATALVLQYAIEAIAARGIFRVVLAGGETPRSLYGRLATADAAWAHWQVYFGDERCLLPADPGRNSRMAETLWLHRVAIPRAQIHPIPAEQGAEQAARTYAATVRSALPFDLVLLGLGDDGHTASLFPGGVFTGAPVLAVHDAPKPPRERVSLSAATLSQARHVLFLVSGSAKRQAVTQWRAGQDLPAARISPDEGVDIFVDASAWPADASSRD